MGDNTQRRCMVGEVGRLRNGNSHAGKNNPDTGPPGVIKSLDDEMKKKDPDWLKPKGVSYY
jgi:hypothetical protein